MLDDYKETYGLKDLSPDSMRDLADRIKDDASLAETWLNNENRLGREHTEWDNTELYCKLISSEMHELEACRNLGGAQVTDMLGDSFSKKSAQYWADYLVSDWVEVERKAERE